MNEKKFMSIMEEIDSDLRNKNVPIPARPIHALRAVAMRFNVKLMLAPLPSPAIPGRYDTNTLPAHIKDWYDSRYGDRLKSHFGSGSVVLLIKGDPWEMDLPRIYGEVDLICDPEIEKYRNMPMFTVSKKDNPKRHVLNPLICIRDYPEGSATALSSDERLYITNFFVKSYTALQQLESIADKPFIKEAMADLQSATNYILSKSPQYGLSKWSSLQFAEKLLKSFLKLKDLPIPKHHDLIKIAQVAQQMGLVISNLDILSKIQCTAGVRYGEVEVTLEEAITAHHAALELIMQLSDQIKAA